MYVRNFAGLGFDFSSIADTAGSLVSTGSKAVSAIKGGGGAGGNASQPKGAKGAPAPQNWIESQSNTTLAIGGLALFALLLALES